MIFYFLFYPRTKKQADDKKILDKMISIAAMTDGAATLKISKEKRFVEAMRPVLEEVEEQERKEEAEREAERKDKNEKERDTEDISKEDPGGKVHKKILNRGIEL